MFRSEEGKKLIEEDGGSCCVLKIHSCVDRFSCGRLRGTGTCAHEMLKTENYVICEDTTVSIEYKSMVDTNE